jgi:hypothetical protein
MEILGRNLGKQSERNLGLIRAFMSGIGDPDLAAVARSIGTQHQEGLITVVKHGIDRGELPTGTDPQRVVEPMLATIFMRMSMFGQTPSLEDIEKIIDLILDGARSGAACGHPMNK